MTVTSWDREKGRPSHYDVLEVGYNFRFDDIRAAIGLAQLEKLDGFNSRRQELVNYYNRCFKNSGLELVLPLASVPGHKEPACHIYPVLFRLPRRTRPDGNISQIGRHSNKHPLPAGSSLFGLHQAGSKCLAAAH